MKTSGIYKITNTKTGRYYIGSSVDIRNRWKAHRSDLHNNKHRCVALQAAFNSDGESVFSWEICAEISDFSQLRAAELNALAGASAPYNTSLDTLTGPRPGYKHKASSIEMMRQANLGKAKSDTQRKRISAARMGQKYPAISAALRGRKLSEETKAKMRLAHKNRPPMPEQQRARLRETHTGRLFSDSWKANISLSKRGRPWSKARRAAHKARQVSASTIEAA